MRKAIFIYLTVINIIYAQSELKHEVYFDTNEFRVSDIEKNRLLLFIKDIDSFEIESISIYGFCDDRGSDTYNLNLSQQRADEILSVFAGHSRHESIIERVDGRGKILLIEKESKNPDITRSLNRKVEVIVALKLEIPEGVEVAEVRKPDTPEVLKGELGIGDKVLLQNILFETGNSDITPESKEILEKIAAVLIEQDHLYFTIQGHVCCTKNTRDAVDSRTNKRNLSLARAEYIYNYLVKKGVDKKRMKYVGLRRRFPLGGDPKYDRRVEILITYIAEKK
jgi:outer membrane protein OmpA-like peptidoglycan-associated protein